MKNKYFFIFIPTIIILGIVAFAIYYNSNNDNNNNNIYGSRISANINTQNVEDENSNYQEEKNKEKEENKNNNNNKEISTFSTTLYDKSEGRLTNINITCSILNNTIVKASETFSFNNVIGQPTAQKGYKEAPIIIDHKTEKGIGGGNCQVSSTLYNAVLAIPNLKVIERHEHGKDVPYVPDGKDAAISYGSLDFKFKNDLGKDIKIIALTDNQSVTIKLIEL